MARSVVFVITVIILFTGVECLKLVRLSVPQYKLRGEMAVLECQYELEGDTLYAIKWYKENEEFYKYVPKANPPQVSYKVEGVRVEHQFSDSRKVAIRGVTLKSTGVYKCEVSAEAPSFSSGSREAKMEVLFLPTNGPHISGEKKQYMIGDRINLNCTSSKSYPASVLDWYINDKLVPESGVKRYPNEVHTHGLITTSLGLSTNVMPQYFTDGSMRLKCVASLSPVLWKGDRESVVQSMVSLLDNQEALLLVKGGGSKTGAGWWIVLLVGFVILGKS